MSDDKREKKEQLRSKVQALVSYYEDEKRRNEELEMEIERLKAEQQRARHAAPPQQSYGGFQMDAYAPPPQHGGYPPQQPAAYSPPPPPTPQFGGYHPAAPKSPQPAYGLNSFGATPAAPSYGGSPSPHNPFGGGYGAPAPQSPPSYGNYGRDIGQLTMNINQVVQTIEQVRMRLLQQRSYGNYHQPDYETMNLLDRLYDQLGDLTRDLAMQRYHYA